jgi:hypothetical protein
MPGAEPGARCPPARQRRRRERRQRRRKSGDGASGGQRRRRWRAANTTARPTVRVASGTAARRAGQGRWPSSGAPSAPLLLLKEMSRGCQRVAKLTRQCRTQASSPMSGCPRLAVQKGWRSRKTASAAAAAAARTPRGNAPRRRRPDLEYSPRFGLQSLRTWSGITRLLLHHIRRCALASWPPFHARTPADVPASTRAQH